MENDQLQSSDKILLLSWYCRESTYVQLDNTDTILRSSSPFWEDALSKPVDGGSLHPSWASFLSIRIVPYHRNISNYLQTAEVLEYERTPKSELGTGSRPKQFL
jgi:hypothetical protein